ncbi:unnamed protein product [Mesocestoides corti]|uniref:Granulins domain-containing protein n=1 Tax=Mesocestoides corti TaxID=53468 RepID=A0A0R3ULK4_MESCO|nr:unnamed protein product [Mesocestoides corti]
MGSGIFPLLNFITNLFPSTQVSTELSATAPITNMVKNLTHLSCSPSSTPCDVRNGGVSCCPFENGVCCEDDDHCCPSGYICDVTSKSCLLSPPPKPEAPADETNNCPLEESGCLETDTCCVMFDGTKGCCPYQDADCCADGVHCCPNGTRCNAASDGCEPAGGPWINPFLPGYTKNGWQKYEGKSADAGDAAFANSTAPKAVCPDKNRCPDTATCCKTKSGDYGCCPFENAVCCNDREHCCPHGFTCDVKHQRCRKPRDAVAHTAPTVSADDRAVFCADQEHCCPDGYSCDPLGFCVDALNDAPPEFLPWRSKVPAQQFPIQGVRCDDGVTTCPDNTTCCQMPDSSYGCCFIPRAVCCSDHLHCCPEHHHCNPAQSLCVPDAGGEPTPWLLKAPGWRSAPPPPPPQVRVCGGPGGRLGCPLTSTCCPSNGDFACCPFENGVCCPNRSHCCPSGYTCEAGGKCLATEEAGKLIDAQSQP